MREAQKDYFRTRTQLHLSRSKTLESKVDAEIERVKELTLFLTPNIMKQFDLETYNRMIAEGKTPKIVTRDGRDIRILCTDRKYEGETIVALINEDGDERIYTFYPCGSYLGEGEHEKDLFFADIEPSIRPYKDKDEVMKAIIHNCGWVKEKATGVCESIQIVRKNRDGRLIVGAKSFDIDMETLLTMYTWYLTDDPCGVKEEEV